MSHSDTAPTPILERELRSDASDARRRWTAGRVAALAIRALLALLALTLLGAGGAAFWADRTQRDGGYVTTDRHSFSTSGSALVTEETELGTAGVGRLYGPGLLGKIRIRVTPRRPAPKRLGGV